ncbi:MAG: NIPSNAP family protein [Chloroflexi bacterium]|nr:NIPSNAP family protein [Chloroflexota bacterium]
MHCIIEIRSYNLKPGTRATLHDLFVNKALPMLIRWEVDVVAYGPSLHDENSFYLIRSYANLKDREQSQDAFYGSDEWRSGPREAILALIDSYTDTVIEVDEVTLQGLRLKRTV